MAFSDHGIRATCHTGRSVALIARDQRVLASLNHGIFVSRIIWLFGSCETGDIGNQGASGFMVPWVQAADKSS
jgi:hypothetical protein